MSSTSPVASTRFVVIFRTVSDGLPHVWQPQTSSVAAAKRITLLGRWTREVWKQSSSANRSPDAQRRNKTRSDGSALITGQILRFHMVGRQRPNVTGLLCGFSHLRWTLISEQQLAQQPQVCPKPATFPSAGLSKLGLPWISVSESVEKRVIIGPLPPRSWCAGFADRT